MTMDEALALVDFAVVDSPKRWHVEMLTNAQSHWGLWAVSDSLEALMVLTEGNPNSFRVTDTQTGMVMPLLMMGDVE